MKKWQKFLLWALWAFAFVVADEILIFWTEHSMLNRWHILLVELMFLGLGWLCARLEIKLTLAKTKKPAHKREKK